MRYLDVDLEIGPGTGRSYPLVVRSAAGDTRVTMQFPYTELALKDTLKDLRIALLQSSQTHRSLTDEEQAVQQFGQQLFEALFAGGAGNLYYASRAKATEAGLLGVRLRLHIQAPDLAGLPWEYLYDPGQDEFLCLSHSTSVVRYPELAEPLQPLQVTPPLRILSMIASPSDQDRLDVKREQARMEDALKTLNASGQIELTWLAGQTWEDLQEAMWHGPWHIFHFIGHGGYDKRADEGVIAFCDEEGQAHLLGARDLARLLTGHRALRLVVLNACDGAKGGSSDRFSSTAATLAKRGIPAVLAMQEEITDKAAIQLTRTFYRALANGQPVDAALDDARTAMSVALRHSLEWGTPVLYLRAPDSTLFTLSSAPPPAPARTPEAPPAQTEPAPPVTRAAQPEAPAPPPPPAKTKEQWVEEGEQHRAAGHHQEALACFEQAITMDPSYVLAIRGQSSALFTLKRYEEALKAADEAIRRGPGDAAAQYNKGQFLSSLQRYQEALPAFDEAIKRNPQFGWAYTAKGQALAALGKHAEALAAFEQALRITPADAAAARGQEAARGALQQQAAKEQAGARAQGTLLLTCQGHKESVCGVAWAPDGKRLASASEDGTVRVWDAASGKRLLTCQGHKESVECVAWAPDGTRLASASRDRTVRVWDAASGRQLLSCQHASEVAGVAWAPDGSRLASGSFDGSVRVWDAASGRQLLSWGHKGMVLGVAWAPDGSRLASGGFEGSVCVWDAASGRQLLSCQGHTADVHGVTWAPDGRRLASASSAIQFYQVYQGNDNTVRVWDATSGRQLLSCQHESYVDDVAWAPDGTRLASASFDNTVRVWDATSGRQLLSCQHTDAGCSVAWAPDGRRLASGSLDGTVRVWWVGEG